MSKNNIRKEFTFTRRQVLGLSVMGVALLTLGGCAKKPSGQPEGDSIDVNHGKLIKPKRKYISLEEIYKNAVCNDKGICEYRLIPILTMGDDDKPIKDPITGLATIEGYITPKCRTGADPIKQHRFVLYRKRVPVNKPETAEVIMADSDNGKSIVAFTTLDEAMDFRNKLDQSDKEALAEIQKENKISGGRLAVRFNDIEAASKKISDDTPFSMISRDNVSSFLHQRHQPTAQPIFK